MNDNLGHSPPARNGGEAREGPDGAREHLFMSLEEHDPELAAELKERCAKPWLAAAGLPAHRLEDAIGTIELKLASEDRAARRALRITSFFTGST